MSGLPLTRKDPCPSTFPCDIPEIESICESTGGNINAGFIITQHTSTFKKSCLGRSYCVTSPKMFNMCLENLVAKVQSGVIIVLEKHGSDPESLNNGTVDCVDGKFL